MDSMRSVLMALGIVLHSSQLFNPERGWRLYHNESLSLAQYLVEFIHAFRMPAFFVISGVFFIITFRKYDFKRFLKVRVNRVLIPLIATALTLNLLQVYILNTAGWSNIDLSILINEGEWVSHLWFLINLLIYFIVLAVTLVVLPEKLKTSLKWLINKIFSMPLFIIILFLPIFSISVLAINKAGVPLYEEFYGITSLYVILKFIPFFIFGILLGLNKNYLNRFSSQNILVLSAVVIFLWLASTQLTSISSPMIKQLTISYLDSLISWVLILICFAIFYNFVNSYSKIWENFSQASYSIYLFHHILVISIGILLINSTMPAVLAFPLLICLTFFLSYQIHQKLILKFKLLRFLYNGK
ncbi:acyltransferase family protein [Aliikangiella maris]